MLPHYRGVLVHDSLSLYAGYTHCGHQLCGAHLIRDRPRPNQSEHGATAWLAVRSYLDSARKHGISTFEAILRVFTGNLWIPSHHTDQLTSQPPAPSPISRIPY